MQVAHVLQIATGDDKDLKYLNAVLYQANNQYKYYSMGLKMKQEKELKIGMGGAIFGMFLFLGLFIWACVQNRSGKIIAGFYFFLMIYLFIKYYRMYKKHKKGLENDTAES